jgi:hypothetical protein
MYLANNAYFL